MSLAIFVAAESGWYGIPVHLLFSRQFLAVPWQRSLISLAGGYQSGLAAGSD